MGGWGLSAARPRGLDIAMTPRFYVEQTLFTSLPLAFSFLHFLLFAFSPKSKQNLYFAVLTALFGLAAFLEFEISQGVDGLGVSFSFNRLVVFALVLTAFLLLYSLQNDWRPHRRFAVFAAITGVAWVVGFLWPSTWNAVTAGFFLVCAVEFLRESAQLRGQKDIWIVFLGIGTMLIGAILDVLIDLGTFESVFSTTNPWLYGGLGLLVSISVFLARSSARAGALEADNARKTLELEEARALQLSLLPKEIPSYPGYQIAAEMITATEVGGDYYDFELDEGGSLVVAVGDAVGHGARAGTLVAATKSLFSAGIRSTPLQVTLAEFDRALGRMGMKRAFVALLLARFRRNRVAITSAGMPQPLLYRAATGKVEEMAVEGPPLGTPLPAHYRSAEFELAPGDTLLLSSDGLPELETSSGGAVLGYAEARTHFERSCGGTAQEVAEQLQQLVESQSSGMPPRDDVTFVVIKKLDVGTSASEKPSQRA